MGTRGTIYFCIENDYARGSEREMIPIMIHKLYDGSPQVLGTTIKNFTDDATVENGCTLAETKTKRVFNYPEDLITRLLILLKDDPEQIGGVYIEWHNYTTVKDFEEDEKFDDYSYLITIQTAPEERAGTIKVEYWNFDRHKGKLKGEEPC